jgi:hypothetical protein
MLDSAASKTGTRPLQLCSANSGDPHIPKYVLIFKLIYFLEFAGEEIIERRISQVWPERQSKVVTVIK